jgi:opacity protein-like surface antigen
VTLDYMFPAGYSGTVVSANDVSARIGATTALFNGYIDLGTWYGLTPYIGAGAGAAFARISDFQRPLVPFAGATTRTQTNFAYALMGGVAWAIAPNLALDIGYRYLNIGDVKTASDAFGDLTIRNVAAHQVRVGVRWGFDDL